MEGLKLVLVDWNAVLISNVYSVHVGSSTPLLKHQIKAQIETK